MPIYRNSQGNFLVSFSPARIYKMKSGVMYDGLLGFRQKYFVIPKSNLLFIFYCMALMTLIQFVISILTVLVYTDCYGKGFPLIGYLERYFILSVFLFIGNYFLTYSFSTSTEVVSIQDEILIVETKIFHFMLVLECLVIVFVYISTVIKNNSSVLMIAPLMAFIAIVWMHIRLLIGLPSVKGGT